MKRAKLRGLERNSAVLLANVSETRDAELLAHARGPPSGPSAACQPRRMHAGWRGPARRRLQSPAPDAMRTLLLWITLAALTAADAARAAAQQPAARAPKPEDTELWAPVPRPVDT